MDSSNAIKSIQARLKPAKTFHAIVTVLDPCVASLIATYLDVRFLGQQADGSILLEPKKFQKSRRT